ncbi:MAG: hypothetical protein HZB33_02940 [Nitrospirae bacterium]|nr:hypothetical protein [Nitrospirota bacterium]
MLLVLLCRGSSYSAISIYADGRGNIVSAPPARSETKGLDKAPRYGVPEGTELLKNVEYEFYLVSGRTFSEVIKSIDENGPFNRDRSRRLPYRCDWVLGVTYQFSATYAIEEESAKVHVEFTIYDISTDDRIHIMLPALIDDTFLNPVEKNIWNQYLLRLVGQAHDTVKILRDPGSGRKVSDGIGEISYVIFDYKEGMDVEKAIESYLKQESEKLVSDWARESGRRVSEYEKTTAYGLKHEMRVPFFKENN